MTYKVYKYIYIYIHIYIYTYTHIYQIGWFKNRIIYSYTINNKCKFNVDLYWINKNVINVNIPQNPENLGFYYQPINMLNKITIDSIRSIFRTQLSYYDEVLSRK